jgi:hypothetical protein
MAAEAPEGTSPRYQPELTKYDDLPDAVSKVGLVLSKFLNMYFSDLSKLAVGLHGLAFLKGQAEGRC